MTAVSPEQVLKDLRKLWADLAQEDPQGVLRACSMTLIVATEGRADEAALGETIGALTHEFPSRAIWLRTQPDGSELAAQVTAQCWMPFGKRQQICAERIDIDTPGERLDRAADLLRGLVVPDLPVVLYCRDLGLFDDIGFGLLLPLVTRLILDGSRAPSSVAVLRRLSGYARARFTVADLAWARLTPWRQAIAQVFDDPAARAVLHDIEEVRILYAWADEPVGAYYLAGWFMHVLGGGPHLSIARGVGPAYGALARVSLHAPGFEASIELLDCCAIEVTVNGTARSVVFPSESEQGALREELSVAGSDPTFQQSLALAALLAGATA